MRRSRSKKNASAGIIDSAVYAMIDVVADAYWPWKAVTPSGKRHAFLRSGE